LCYSVSTLTLRGFTSSAFGIVTRTTPSFIFAVALSHLPPDKAAV